MNRSTRNPFFLVVMFSILFAGFAQAEQAQVGSPAPEFTLADTNGTSHVLSTYRGKFVVLEWNNPDCPFVRKHYDGGNMQNLQKKYIAQGVVWLAINSSAEGRQGYYAAEDHNKILAERGASPSALLLDSNGSVGRLYGANTTPHMFVINPEGILIYNGAIDEDPWGKAEDLAGVKNYVGAALDEAMSGGNVSTPVSKPYGCSVKYA